MDNLLVVFVGVVVSCLISAVDGEDPIGWFNHPSRWFRKKL